MTVNSRFNAAAHPKDPRDGRFVEVPLVDPGHVLGDSPLTTQRDTWAKRGVSPESAQWWADAGFSAAASDGWRRGWFSAPEAARWRAAGFDALTAGLWRDARFSPAAAVAYQNAGFSPEQAQRWRDDGLSQPPAPAGDLPPVGEAGPADMTGEQLQLAGQANPYLDVVIPPQEPPTSQRR